MLLAQLRARDDASPPAIAVTGYSEQKWRSKASDCGFVRYAVKPFSLQVLVDWIAELTATSETAGAPSASYPLTSLRASGARLPR